MAILREKTPPSPDSGSRVLDVGCGYGGLLKTLRALGIRDVVGIDLYSPTRELTVREFGVEVIFAEFESYDFGDSRFDLIVSQHMLEHVPDPSATCRPPQSGRECVARNSQWQPPVPKR